MDDEPSVQAESQSESTVEGSGPPHDQFTGAFFPQAHHLTVAGGQFRSITNVHHAPSTAPSDFRRFPLGDLDLRNEIQSDSGMVCRRRGRHSVRRVYSAQIHGSKSPMTVALYQGENAEEEWRQDVSRYSWLRHPNLVQLFGTINSSGIHAAIFLDELIPAKQVMEKYRDSHLAQVYLWAHFNLRMPDNISELFRGNFRNSWECTIWIRPSTGRLCLDFALPEDDCLYLLLNPRVNSVSSLLGSGLEPPEDWKIIDLILLAHYHEICYSHFQHYHPFSVSTNASVHLGALIHCPPGSDIEHSKEIAFIPDVNFVDLGWRTTKAAPLSVMESGWTRVNSCDLRDGVLSHSIVCNYRKWYGWLTQANHIFNRLRVSSNYEDYVFVLQIVYGLTVYNTSNSIPSGYLFLCPLADLQPDNPSYFRHPECVAYWSLDPSGDERLGIEEAGQLGFPAFEFTMDVLGFSWNESVYAGIRQFHQGKGFDPDSQDVARELGLPLYQVSTDLDGPFAHLKEIEDRREDSENEDVQLIHESPSEAMESNLDSYLVLEASCTLDDVEIAEPCRTWRIVMGVQFALILTTTILWLHDLFHSHNLTNS